MVPGSRLLLSPSKFIGGCPDGARVMPLWAGLPFFFCFGEDFLWFFLRVFKDFQWFFEGFSKVFQGFF